MAETMRAAVYRGIDRVEVEQVPIPEIGSGEVLVRVAVCGVCGTDLKKIHLGLTPPPRIFGHETAGTIAAIGAGVTVRVNWPLTLSTVHATSVLPACFPVTNPTAVIEAVLEFCTWNIPEPAVTAIRFPVWLVPEKAAKPSCNVCPACTEAVVSGVWFTVTAMLWITALGVTPVKTLELK